ncbi:hypothetical protein K457DRAFT_123443 [Linnemannia elongata AG-77]|uniref:Endonuclease n=1 Tax=Linnemannia elongata AG-77 TaxID=1314771 RepID=A0A197K4K7_9FUNG|nr:hypothetical protein K457DRAFT_123443 [Linnemannia elongata AG-77]
MNFINPYSKQRLARGAIFVCRVLLGSLAVISFSSSSHIDRRDTPTAPIPANIATREEFRYGYPGPVVDINAAEAYVSAYDRRTRNPHWSAEYLTKTNLLPNDPQTPPSPENNFSEDPTIPAQFRAGLSSYTGSGYDRGQQTPAGDAKRSQSALDETFVLSNSAPQVGKGFSRDYWASFENFVRDLTKEFDHVYVITGPLYIPTDAPPSGKATVTYQVLYGAGLGIAPISVPTHFHKTILVVKGDTTSPTSSALGLFIMPNAAIDINTPLINFIADIGKVEVSAGVVFFDKVDRASVQRLCDATTCKLNRQ